MYILEAHSMAVHLALDLLLVLYSKSILRPLVVQCDVYFVYQSWKERVKGSSFPIDIEVKLQKSTFKPLTVGNSC